MSEFGRDDLEGAALLPVILLPLLGWIFITRLGFVEPNSQLVTLVILVSFAWTAAIVGYLILEKRAEDMHKRRGST